MPKKPPKKALPPAAMQEVGGPLHFTTESWITAPLPRVWQLATKGAWLDQYFTSETSGNLDAPGRVRLSWGDIHENLDVIASTWEKKTVFLWVAYQLPYATRVTFSFAAKNGMTQFKITESGWKQDAKGSASALHHAIGWTHFLLQLKAFAQFGITLRS